MNAKKSLFVFGLGIIILAGVVVGFAHGAKTLDTNFGTGIAWMSGSIVVACLGVYFSYKLKRKG